MKVGIVGSGLVGSTAAYALVMRGVGREIVLVDHHTLRAQAEADDIRHAVPFANPLKIRAGEYLDLAGSRVVIIAAGVNQQPGESRLDLLKRNAEVFHQVIPQVVEHAPNAILLIATNPVDIMTHIAEAFATDLGLPSTRVIGSGTTLDTARFRSLLGEHVDVDPGHVHAHVIGEHGDTEVLTWSLATISGMPLDEFCRLKGTKLDAQRRDEIDRRVRGAAYSIIEGKGATYYGIGSALARIVDVILHDQRSILTICSRLEQVAGVTDVTLSMPHLLGGNGALASIPLQLVDSESTALQRSAEVIREAIDSLQLDARQDR